MTSPDPVRRALAAGAAALLLTGLTACGAGAGQAEPTGDRTRAFTSDHTGEPVRIPADPQRIVAIGWAVTPLISVEEADLVGVTRGTQDTSLTPEELEKVESLPSVGTDLDISVEEVAALEPDLIVSGLAAAMDYDYADLEQVAPVAVAAMNTPAEWKDMNDRVADAAGVADAHAELKERYDERAAEIEETHADVLADTRFASIAAFGDGNWTLEHRDAHGTTVPADAGLDFTEQAEGGAFSESLSYEELDRLDDYDAVLTRATEEGEPTEQIAEVMEQGPWRGVEPVREEHVYHVPRLGAMSYTSGLLVLDELEERVLSDLQ
ncbi:iron complex transport system substrate-binding protein [Spinactinospora alkalitolerans]|uniref:Iron complex transport system substrate-binding protein n=1 Tax=Spinactinospora alkalitolerans TaxID=687207 RepID=A0A852TT62_9ACTN|nr:ABC transporter substrate-binding protein [Spinactinospora alkalitolerans]NYE46841.1 iron complex transport system substrate-binding protein [Spinactinospora alkalitolerans]